jgi:hypothetical protein
VAANPLVDDVSKTPPSCPHCGFGRIIDANCYRNGERGRAIGWLLIVGSLLADALIYARLWYLIEHPRPRPRGPEALLAIEGDAEFFGLMLLMTISAPVLIGSFFMVRKVRRRRCNVCHRG